MEIDHLARAMMSATLPSYNISAEDVDKGMRKETNFLFRRVGIPQNLQIKYPRLMFFAKCTGQSSLRAPTRGLKFFLCVCVTVTMRKILNDFLFDSL